jgi:hypothetical protein
MTNVMYKLLIYLSIYFCLTCLGLSFNPSAEAGVLYNFDSGLSLLGMVSAPGALTPYPGDLNHCWICTPAYEDGLKESPKHVRQK